MRFTVEQSGKNTRDRSSPEVPKNSVSIIDTNGIEILFILGSSRDVRGKRVLIREDGTENYIWSAEDAADDGIMELLGLSTQDKAWIKKFFQKELI